MSIQVKRNVLRAVTASAVVIVTCWFTRPHLLTLPDTVNYGSDVQAFARHPEIDLSELAEELDRQTHQRMALTQRLIEDFREHGLETGTAGLHAHYKRPGYGLFDTDMVGRPYRSISRMSLSLERIFPNSFFSTIRAVRDPARPGVFQVEAVPTETDLEKLMGFLVFETDSVDAGLAATADGVSDWSLRSLRAGDHVTELNVSVVSDSRGYEPVSVNKIVRMNAPGIPVVLVGGLSEDEAIQLANRMNH